MHAHRSQEAPATGFTAPLVISSVVVKDQDQSSEMSFLTSGTFLDCVMISEACLSRSDLNPPVVDVDVLTASELVFPASRRLFTLKHSDTLNTFSKAEIY